MHEGAARIYLANVLGRLSEYDAAQRRQLNTAVDLFAKFPGRLSHALARCALGWLLLSGDALSALTDAARSDTYSRATRID